ncbi:MAG: AAA family ATPase [Bacilli bacterium]|nr:AAA family ATPase [Bacilli bacterium]
MSISRGKTMCISSAKGGVGKTFITTNLAGIFAQLDKKVLILDFDLSNGAIGVTLNTPFEKNIYNFIDDYSNNRYKAFENYITRYNDNIYFLASPKDPRQSNKIDPKYIDIILDKATNLFDIVLIDTNHDFSEFNISTMDKVDQILFVITNDLVDLKNMRSLLSVFKDIELTNYKLLLNNSRDPFKKYFSLYDMKNLLKNNIDYIITSDLFLKNIDIYNIEGKIVSLDPKMPNVFNKDYVTFMTIASDLFESGGNK